MGLQDVGIIGIDDGIIEVLAEKEFGIAHKVLVQRILQGDEETQ